MSDEAPIPARRALCLFLFAYWCGYQHDAVVANLPIIWADFIWLFKTGGWIVIVAALTLTIFAYAEEPRPYWLRKKERQKENAP